MSDILFVILFVTMEMGVWMIYSVFVVVTKIHCTHWAETMTYFYQ